MRCGWVLLKTKRGLQGTAGAACADVVAWADAQLSALVGIEGAAAAVLVGTSHPGELHDSSSGVCV